MYRNDLQKLRTDLEHATKEFGEALRDSLTLRDRVEAERNIVKNAFARWSKILQESNRLQFISSDIEPAMDALNLIITAEGPNLAEDARQKLTKVLNFVTNLYKDVSKDSGTASVTQYGSDLNKKT